MTWYRITSGGRTYVRDPELHIVTDDSGRILSPAELLASWRQVGDVEPLPPGVDPEAVLRISHRPHATTRGGNVGMRPGYLASNLDGGGPRRS